MTPFSSYYRTILAACAALALAPRPCQAQVRASEFATVSQTVDGTVFTISYYRPQARGRTALFGKTIQMGETWTPGANWATVLEVSRDVQLDGHAVPKGKYSVWFIVREREWTVILDPKFQLFHEERPEPTPAQIRWTVRPTDDKPVEILTWAFDQVRADGARIAFAWGPKRVSIEGVVRPSHAIPIARADAAPFLGTYEWRWDDSAHVDTLLHRVTFTHDGTYMRQAHTPFPKWYPRVQGQPMTRINDAWFITAIIIDGKVWEMDSDMQWEFAVTNGTATSFEIRDSKDFLLAKGRRVTAP